MLKTIYIALSKWFKKKTGQVGRNEKYQFTTYWHGIFPKALDEFLINW